MTKPRLPSPLLPLLLATTLTGLSQPAAGADDPAGREAAGVAYFEREVRPVLVARCYECHAADAKKIRGGLTLDTREASRKGGEQGPAVVPGDPGASLLIRAVRYDDPDLKMPPKGKLSDREIAALTRWVEMGAPDPREGVGKTAAKAPTSPRVGPDFWAFQAPADPPLPDVRDLARCATPLDRFILADLERDGLTLAPPAERRALIRRVTFDLTGLPPTTEQVEAFANDSRPDAYERLIDRLLASPRYGERWGRHWLDVARYSDSNGLDENVAHGNAWRYRDWVIVAFNQDKPYDQFLVDQLAGDLLPDDGGDEARNARVIATGFLALGPKVLAEVDETKMEMDIVDEQVDTTGRAFMGLTLGCARCHDHKFDPFPTTDYYGLAGVFTSTKTMENFKKVARWQEYPVGTAADRKRAAEHAAKVEEINKAVAEAARRGDEAVAGKAPAKASPAARESLYPAEIKAELKTLRAKLTAIEKAAPEVPTAMGASEGKVADVRVHIRGSHLALGPLVPRHVPAVLVGSATETPAFAPGRSGRLELARWLTNPSHPLTARVIVNRVWRWHFGRGLVATPDNFGALGARPSHPELLDWLSRRFVEGGWSIKGLHRLILLSSVYRAGGAPDPKALKIDPENRRYWRFTPRRLEAEAVRDALLAVSGKLDATMGGSLLQVKNRAYFFDHTSKDLTRYDSDRRSVYLPVVRNHVYDVFELFDFADPGVASGDRATTTVAPQALFLMNGEFVERAAEGLASASEGPGGDEARLERLYLRAYGRTPKPSETRRDLGFVARFAEGLAGDERDPAARARLAWQALAQAVLASNEFLYLP